MPCQLGVSHHAHGLAFLVFLCGCTLVEALRTHHDDQYSSSMQTWLRHLDTATYPIDLRGHFGEHNSSSKVLHVIFSDSMFYDTRLAWIEQTWADALPRDRLLVLSDKAPREDELKGLTVLPSKCAEHDHWAGLCCKYAEGMIAAHAAMQLDPEITWAYLGDDDTYRRPEALEEALKASEASVDPSTLPSGVIYGVWGCRVDSPSCQLNRGLCGGGGWAASRAAVASLVGTRPGDLLRETMQNCDSCEMWSDIALSVSFEKRSILTLPMQGIQPWTLTKAEFDEGLAAAVEPVQYHYINTEGAMRFLHELFQPEEADAIDVFLDEASATQQCSTFRDRTVCASVGQDEVPWSLDG